MTKEEMRVNVIMSLELGLIDWFQYFNLMKELV